MGIFDDLFRGGRKSSSHIRNHNREQKLRDFEYINKKYNLGLTYEQLNHSAWEYGDAVATKKRKSRQRTLTIVPMLVVATIFAPFTAGSSFLLGSLLVGTAAGIIQYGLNLHIARQSEKKQAQILNLQAQILKKQTTNAKKQQLTEVLMYFPQEIFPMGKIWEAQKPGSHTYSPSIAYFAGKGIGQALSQEESDEFIMNRAHYNGAGNEGYFMEFLNPQTLNQKHDFWINIKKEKSKAMLRAKNHYEEGFKNLFLAGFADYPRAFDPNKLMQQRMQKLLSPYCKGVFTFDFLQKITHYAKAEPANFSFVWERQINPYFKPFKDNKSQNLSGLRRIFKKRI